jgi:hypothetical protein
MGVQISPVFQAVEEAARKYRTTDLVFQGAMICRRAMARRKEIQQLRESRERMRRHAEQVGARNGHLLTGEIHPIELEAIHLLRPDLASARGHDLTREWREILKQPWGKEFAATTIERTRH